ncbi:methyltransferase-like protein 22 isoform X2 [Sphaerodactylus townsendi]|uniref:methyltransferase-like protein 22 isoform X2 n=1 Tax=Sphaerodactylus townsendi TaxID=933632 RepID=UPI002025B675|nr:methyltransferase-like protein 22 isoform X2 [Sphaerodactylus townsendi]XP_048350278.1 methyltransferase-like protein 22 isoform X2 [Sphaerodactylus townsendi]
MKDNIIITEDRRIPKCFCLRHATAGAGEREAMDEMTFRSDTVLSDVHMHIPSKRHFMVRLNTVGQPVFLSQFSLLLEGSHSNLEKKEKDFKEENIKCHHTDGEELEEEGNPCDPGEEGKASEGIEALLDEDGDLEVVRKAQLPGEEAEDLSRDKVCPIILTKGRDVLEEEEHESDSRDVIKIEHTMATPLEDVGKQVWRGAFLLVDYILSEQDLFKDCTVLELGGGTGIVSIAAATAAKTVYCTDVGEDLLDTCERNIALNKHITESAGGQVNVRVLDWLKDEFCTDPDSPYSWSEQEIAELHNFTTVILAADVFYDDDLTNAFFSTLYRITHNLNNPCVVYLSIEKRLNFTLRHMEVACEAYSHFRNTLDGLTNIRDGKMRYTAEPLGLSFPQRIVYERVEQLELWKITAVQTSKKNSAEELQK